jgi:3-oxoacyl-[acyl-carrier protein] reductase
VAQQFDASESLWTPADLDAQLGGWFADHDPSVGFAADAIMGLKPASSHDSKDN